MTLFLHTLKWEQCWSAKVWIFVAIQTFRFIICYREYIRIQHTTKSRSLAVTMRRFLFFSSHSMCLSQKSLLTAPRHTWRFTKLQEKLVPIRPSFLFSSDRVSEKYLKLVVRDLTCFITIAYDGSLSTVLTNPRNFVAAKYMRYSWQTPFCSLYEFSNTSSKTIENFLIQQWSFDEISTNNLKASKTWHLRVTEWANVDETKNQR